MLPSLLAPSRCVLLLMLCFMHFPSIFGQASSDVSQGINPIDTYSSTQFDSVDMITGRLSLHVPLLSDHSQREALNFDYAIVWSGQANFVPDCTLFYEELSDTCQWTIESGPIGGPTLVMEQGLSRPEPGEEFNPYPYTNPLFACSGTTQGDGGMHSFEGSSTSYTSYCPSGDPIIMESIDASGMQMELNNTTAVDVVTNNNGIRFSYPHVVEGGTTPLPYITDPNGNKITVTSGTAGNYVLGFDFGPELFQGWDWSMEDTVGRTWSRTSTMTVSVTCPTHTSFSYQWLVPGSTGPKAFTFCTGDGGYNTDLPTNPPGATTTDQIASIGGVGSGLVEAVILPNGTSYVFHSDDGYGDITELDLPTGSKIYYGWSTICAPEDQYTSNCGDRFVRTLVCRQTDGTAPCGSSPHTSYALTPESSGHLYSTMTVTSPVGNDTVYVAPYNPPYEDSFYTWYPGWCDPVNAVSYYQGSSTSGTLLKQVNTTATLSIPNPFARHQVLPETTETILGSATNSTSQSYDFGFYYDGGWSPYGLTTSVTQTNYDSSTISTTTTNYLALSTGGSSYLAANLLNLPASVTITDGSSHLCAETNYFYDASTPVTSGITLSSPSIVRGNPSSKNQKLFANACQSASPSATNLTTYYTVYDTGMVSSVQDPKTSVTTTTYDSSGKFPLEIQYPNTGVSHNDYYSYDDNTGDLLTHVDQNGSGSTDAAHMTTYSYDIMGRLIDVKYPPTAAGQAETQHCYTDSGGAICGQSAAPFSEYTMTVGSPDPNIISYRSFDGLGRAVRSVAPNGAITDTAYDPDDNIASTSNPYFSVGDLTYGVTLYAYDALHRKTYQCDSDNGSVSPCLSGGVAGASYSQWVYADNTVTATDENGNSTTRTTDGAGRLVQVVEPGALTTGYGYDALGNLLAVNQHGNGSSDTVRNRTFTYDSLSRLLCASNPETSTAACSQTITSYTPGTTWYSYDGDGNLASKEDPRGTVITYDYDALNRLSYKTYSGTGSSASQKVCYSYDSVTNGNGKLAGELTESGSSCTSPSGITTQHTILAYDAMGRLTSEQRCVQGNCTSSSPSALQYTYDLAGNLTSYTNGLTGVNGALTLSNYFDSAGRLTDTTSSWNDDTHPWSLWSAQSFGPAGVTSARLGFHVAFTRTYDQRLRPNSETAFSY